MAGQLIRRGERTWLVRIYLGADSRTGKRIYENKTIHGTKKDAEKWRNEALRRRDLGETVGQSPMLSEEFFERWLASSVKQRVRASSLESYTFMIQRYAIPALGGLRLSAIRPVDIQHLYSNLLAQGLSTTTVGYLHVLIKSAFKQAVRWGLVHRNPADMVDPPRQERREMQAFSAAEARHFLEAVTDERYLIVFATAIATGCRPSEYLGMRWADLDFQAGSVTIQRALIWARSYSTWTIGEPKTPHSRRTISLPPPVLLALEGHKLRQAEDRRTAGVAWQDLDLVFTRPDGGPLGIWEVRDKFKQAVKAAGLRQMPLYCLRHTTATVLMMAGENPKVVQERMGHANIGITLGIYSHVLPGMQEQATKRLEKAVLKASAHNRHTTTPKARLSKTINN